MAEVLPTRPGDIFQQSVPSVVSVDPITEYADPPGGPYGERLVVHAVDELARRSPDRVYATLSKSVYNLDEGFRDITTRQLADAVNCAAWLIDGLFGRSKSFEVIAYMGVSDIRYAFYTFAAIKTGHVIMIPSVRNSTSQHLAVFEEAKCDKVFYTPEMGAKINELKASMPRLTAVEVPSLDDLISSQSKHYEYNRTWAAGRTDPIIVAHSSGSTGNPKPTTINNGVYSTYDNHRRIPAVPGRKIQGYTLLEFDDNGRFFCPFPPFHLAGLFAMTIMPIFYSSTVTFGPPEKPPTGELVSQAMSLVKFRGVWSPPSIIEQLAALPGGLNQIATLDWMIYTGGPLAPSVGDVVSRVTDLCQLYGSTETGPHVALIPLPENWNWFEWHPVIQNAMEPVGDGTYEMVCYKEPKWNHLLHLQQAYPEIEVWRTRDLFIQNPENPKLWRFAGRRDDVIVLSNGEKFNPVNMEGIITGHPLVNGSIIVGTSRIQACLIIEPAEGITVTDSELIDKIWPTVLDANLVGPAHGRIFRHKVMIAGREKPFIRAGKGTIIRAQTARLFEEEIEELYREAPDKDTGAPVILSVETVESLINYSRVAVEWVLSQSNVPIDEDLFVLGMDSLQTLELSKAIQRAITPHLREKDSSFVLQAPHIYSHPTIQELGNFLFDVLHGTDLTESKDRSTAMAHLVDKYTIDLGPVKDICVAVTGSTGSLGSYILETLLNDNKVTKIYCLNRSSDAATRQKQIFQGRSVNYDLSEKVTFLTVKLGQPQFGLSDLDYRRLASEANAIIHNAWKVDFNHKLSSFEDVHIRGVRDLINFSLSSQLQPHIFFVSSISSVGNWGSVYGYDKDVPEGISEDFNVSMPLGYAESKHVAELILTSAVASCGLNASILRVGQVAGPVSPDSKGMWNLTEWMPALVKTSKTLGLLPNTMESTDWIPVDTLATIIQQIVHRGCDTDRSQVFNLINPYTANWSDLAASIIDYFAVQSHEIRLTSMAEWVEALREVGDSGLDLDDVPAIKILDFFAGLAADSKSDKSQRLTYETTNARHSSSTMAKLRAIDGECMNTWMRQWSF